MRYTIRAVTAADWRRVRDIRLDALRDPLAHLAFMESYARAAARTDDFWRRRTEEAAAGESGSQFIAEDGTGRWWGTVSVLLEPAGRPTRFDDVPRVHQTHLVGVFVRERARGTGLAARLFDAALGWSWHVEQPRVEQARLFVHEHNTRAEALYRKVGFRPTGSFVPAAADPALRDNEMVLRRG